MGLQGEYLRGPVQTGKAIVTSHLKRKERIERAVPDYALRLAGTAPRRLAHAGRDTGGQILYEAFKKSKGKRADEALV